MADNQCTPSCPKNTRPRCTFQERTKRIMAAALIPPPCSSDMDCDSDNDPEESVSAGLYGDVTMPDESEDDDTVSSDPSCLPQELEEMLNDLGVLDSESDIADEYSHISNNYYQSNENPFTSQTNVDEQFAGFSGAINVTSENVLMDVDIQNYTFGITDKNRISAIDRSESRHDNVICSMPDVDNRSRLNNRADLSVDFYDISKPSCTSSTKTNNQTQYKDTTDMQIYLTLPSTSSGIYSISKTLTRSNKKSTPKVKSNINKESVMWENTTFQHKVDCTDRDLLIPEKIKTPLEYFKTFFPDRLIDLIVYNTNLYSVQTSGISIKVDKSDIRDFIAIHIIMGIVQIPCYLDYWSNHLRYEKIASIMTLKRYQQIRRYIHFVNNEDMNDDRYCKIRPTLDIVRECCSSVPFETRFSVDEMMIPYKGKKASNKKQYMPAKPKKWGFKVFVLAGISGFIYEFIIYGGEDTFHFHTFTEEESQFGLGGQIVIALCKSLPEPALSVVYFDNFFTSVSLVHYLRNEFGILSLGTVKSNRILGGDSLLTSKKRLQKKGRGSFSQLVSNLYKVCIVRWLDNKPVTMVSSYADSFPVQTAKRFNKEQKERLDVTCPFIIKEYNKHMGGVDLSGMVVSLYRTQLKSRRWYLNIFAQVIDICINNAWLLRKRDLCLMNVMSQDMSLKQSHLQIYEALIMKDRVRGLPSNGTTPMRKITKPVQPRPCDEVRLDMLGHLPEFTTRGRCKLCKKDQSHVQCTKCNVRLCLKEKRNCFLAYHSRQ